MIFRWRLNTKSKFHTFFIEIWESFFQKELNLFDEVEFTKPRIVNLQTTNMMMIEMIPINATDKVWQNNT